MCSAAANVPRTCLPGGQIYFLFCFAYPARLRQPDEILKNRFAGQGQEALAVCAQAARHTERRRLERHAGHFPYGWSYKAAHRSNSSAISFITVSTSLFQRARASGPYSRGGKHAAICAMFSGNSTLDGQISSSFWPRVWQHSSDVDVQKLERKLDGHCTKLALTAACHAAPSQRVDLLSAATQILHFGILVQALRFDVVVAAPFQKVCFLWVWILKLLFFLGGVTKTSDTSCANPAWCFSIKVTTESLRLCNPAFGRHALYRPPGPGTSPVWWLPAALWAPQPDATSTRPPFRATSRMAWLHTTQIYPRASFV